jgi:hypothetical protein
LLPATSKPTLSCSFNTSFPTPTGFVPFNLALSFRKLEFLETFAHPLPLILPLREALLFKLPFLESPPLDCRLACRFRSLTLLFEVNANGTGDRSSASHTAENAP